MNIHTIWSMREPASILLGVIGAFLFPSDHRGSLGVRRDSGRKRKGAAGGECVFLHHHTGVPGGAEHPETEACLVMMLQARRFTILGSVSLCVCTPWGQVPFLLLSLEGAGSAKLEDCLFWPGASHWH